MLALVVVLDTAKSENVCSFVRSYEKEQCVYNIHLTHEDHHCSSSRRGRRHQERRFNTDTRSDYTERIDTMQKDFSFFKDEHEHRLKELETSVQNLLGNGQMHTLLSQTALSLELPSMTESSSPSNSYFPRSSGRVDDGVLDRLQEEFARLRKALIEKTQQLFDTQLKVNESTKMYEQSQLDLYSMNQQLLDTENKVALLERERAVLKNQLKDRAYNLGVSSDRLTECEAKSIEQQDQLLKLIRSENTLSEGLATCQLQLNETQGRLDEVEARHQELKSRNTRTREILGIRERELIDCYSAKTETFCGFEDPSLCGFSQPNDTSDFFDWDWGEGSTPSQHTGPSADHTCGTRQGHFMYIEASAKGRGKNAIIYSPLYRGLKEQCIAFFYHMNGRHIGTLNVYAKARGAELASVWRAYGNQGDIWSKAMLAIPKELARAGFQIAFEGITENGYQGDMAIDDVSVTDGECPKAEGVQTVQVLFNSTTAADDDDVVRDGKNFARNVKRMRLGRVRRKGSKHGKKNDDDTGN